MVGQKTRLGHGLDFDFHIFHNLLFITYWATMYLKDDILPVEIWAIIQNCFCHIVQNLLLL